MYRSHILVCGGTGCTSSGSERIITAFENNKAAPGQPAEKKLGQPTQKPAYRNNNRFARKK